VNNKQWYAHRAEMHNFMPGMIAFKRKRSGVKMVLENIFAWIIALILVAFTFGGAIYTTMTWKWNPVLYVLVALFIDWCVADLVDRFIYKDDSGLHNLKGYDPKTHTVPHLEARGYDTQRFWPSAEHPKYRRR
jgi:hypothetical protein